MFLLILQTSFTILLSMCINDLLLSFFVCFTWKHLPCCWVKGTLKGVSIRVCMPACGRVYSSKGLKYRAEFGENVRGVRPSSAKVLEIVAYSTNLDPRVSDQNKEASYLLQPDCQIVVASLQPLPKRTENGGGSTAPQHTALTADAICWPKR